MHSLSSNYVYVATAGTQTDPKPTCEALNQLIASASTSALTCFRNDAPCDTVACTAAQLPVPVVITQTLLPCEDPPAVRIVIADLQSGNIFLDRTFDESVNGVSAAGVRFDVTLEQLSDHGAIRYGVSL